MDARTLTGVDPFLANLYERYWEARSLAERRRLVRLIEQWIGGLA